MKFINELKVTGLLLITAILLLSACDQFRIGAATVESEATPETAEEGVEATPTAVPVTGTTILAEGQLEAVNPLLPLGFSTNGRLVELHVQAGDSVYAGDLIATLDDEPLQEALMDTALGVRQAENSLAQSQLSLENLLDWAPDDAVVVQAEAALAAAETGLENAQTQDSVAGYSVTAAKVELEQAQEALVEAQDAYDTAFDPGRDWEQFIDDPSCRTAEQFPNCTGPPYSDVIEAEREAAVKFVPQAEDRLRIAQANYSLALAGLNDDSAVSAEANIASAQQALSQALAGPVAEDVAAARLQVEQAELAVEQAGFNQEKAEKALEDSRLLAPWAGTILSVDSSPGSLVGAGTGIVTLMDTQNLQFQTNNLSERDLAQISRDQPVMITLKAFPNEEINGRVLRVAPVAEGTIGDAATFTVIIGIEDADLALLPGMTGRVEIEGK